jgi:chromosome segregation ATPase
MIQEEIADIARNMEYHENEVDDLRMRLGQARARVETDLWNIDDLNKELELLKKA